MTILGAGMHSQSLNHVQLFAAPWTVAQQPPLPMGFSRQEYWSGLPFPSPGDLPNPGIEPRSPALQADALPSEPPGRPKTYLLGHLNFRIVRESICVVSSHCVCGNLLQQQ